jgi:D-alanyl-D-alanine carboxypeptidase (penicillin-binding protein 5/6)
VRIKNTTFTYHGAKTIPIKNSNDLLHTFPACVGMKTGFTNAAGRCLVAAAEENGKVVLAVILGSTMEDVWNDAEKLLRYSLSR